LQEAALVDRLEAIRSEAKVKTVPLLRVLDVAIWMRNWGIGAGGESWDGAERLPFSSREPRLPAAA
jgi:hypothetical protein